MLALAVAVSLAAAPLSTETKSKTHPSFQLAALEFGAGAIATLITVPGSIALGTWIGTATPSLFVSGIPALLVLALLPPVAVVLSEWATGNWLGEGSGRIFPALWTTLGVHVLALVGAGLLGLWLGDLRTGAVFTLIEAILLPGTATASSYFAAVRAAPPAPVAQLELTRAPGLCFGWAF